MVIVGYVLLGLAAVIYFLPLQLLMADATQKSRRDGGVLWAGLIFLTPMWLLLALAMCVATSRGALDWLHLPRLAQYPLAFLTGVAMLIVSLFGLLSRFEHPMQMPRSTRPFAMWVVFVLPWVAGWFVVAGITAAVADAVPGWLYRGPIAVVGGACLLACMGLLVELMISRAKREAARAQATIDFHERRNANFLREVQDMDPLKDMGRLLLHTNQYEDHTIRELALQKVRSHPDLQGELIRLLREGWPSAAMTFLDANDPPDKAGIAEAIRDGILILAAKVRREMREAHHLYDDSFDSDAMRILAVVEKHRVPGVDYAPAIREFREALDEPRDKAIRPGCKRMLDAWLAAEAKRR